MLKKTSPEFRVLFLLQFTKELIRNSKPEGLNIDKSLTKPSPLVAKIEKKIHRKEMKNLPRMRRPKLSFVKRRGFPRPKTLHIPEPKLPPRLQYIQPIPTKKDVNIEKLDALIKDPAVKMIECHGADEKLVVKGTMGTKPTNIILNKEEIDQVIEEFSKLAKIPVHEGIFRVAVGRLLMTAVVSEVISSKFIIKKMALSLDKVFRNVRGLR